jgi:two-component system, OmpR family, phosphate regulon sensor histidine kinase PhoR
MPSGPQRKRVTIFLISVLIPAVVLTGLAIQLYRQQQKLIEQELEKHGGQAHTAEQIHSVYRESDLRFAFYGCAVILALSVTLFCRYVVWQDYRRETELADLRSQFVAHVSHELRTPLTSIQMFAETLALGRVQDPEKQREYLQTIARESERLARLVDQVLAFSKIEQGRGNYRMQSTALVPIVEAAVRAVGPSLAQQGFTLRRNYCGTAPIVRADADALEQAILNLLTNAMKYSDNSRDIELRLCQSADDAIVEVLDQGIGVPLELRERIFEKFFRAPVANSAVAGVGLGLTVVAHVAAAHGGRVEVRGNEPKGSVFSLILPMERMS